MSFIHEGTKEYRNASIALFLGGFVTFSTLYTTQPLMPIFAEEFQVSPTVSSLSLSLSTGLLAISMLFAAVVSDFIGKKKIMTFSLFLTAIIGLLTSFSPNFWFLLLLRAIVGITMAGVPSIAMAYVGEEFDPRGMGKIMGLYISGTSIGGMSGRLFTGILTDLFTWRGALAIIGGLSIILSVIFWKMLPRPAERERKRLNIKRVLFTYKVHLSNRKLMANIFLPFLLMGSFVTLYNYIGFKLMGPPYHLSQTLIGFIFIVYLCGTFSSIYMGKKADLYGNFPALLVSLMLTIGGAIITLFPPLLLKILGIGLFTFGFFASHSIASAWVGERVKEYKAQASSLYLFCYYLGSSIVGTVGGFFWTHFKWEGVVGLVVLLLGFTIPLVVYTNKEEEDTMVTPTAK